MIFDDETEVRAKLNIELPIKLIPLPWENLTSFITRNAVGMHYSRPEWVINPIHSNILIPKTHLPLLHQEAHYVTLIEILHLNTNQIYDMTIHRVGAKIGYNTTRDDRYIFDRRPSSTKINKSLITQHGKNYVFDFGVGEAVCPICLTDDAIPYSRLYWWMKYIRVCLFHGCILISSCPNCTKAIPYLRNNIRICPTCGKGDYANAPIILIPLTKRLSGYLNLFSRKLNINIEYNNDFVILTNLTKLSSQEYLYLLYETCNLLTDLHITKILLSFWDCDFLTEIRNLLLDKTTYFSIKVIDEIATFYCFHLIFENWPENFRTFLSYYAAAYLKYYVNNLYKEIPTLFYYELETGMKSSSFNFLRKALKNFLIDSYEPSQLIYDDSIKSNRGLVLPKAVKHNFFDQVWINSLSLKS